MFKNIFCWARCETLQRTAVSEPSHRGGGRNAYSLARKRTNSRFTCLTLCQGGSILCCNFLRRYAFASSSAVAQNRQYLVSICKRKGFRSLASFTYFVHV